MLIGWLSALYYFKQHYLLCSKLYETGLWLLGKHILIYMYIAGASLFSNLSFEMDTQDIDKWRADTMGFWTPDQVEQIKISRNTTLSHDRILINLPLSV